MEIKTETNTTVTLENEESGAFMELLRVLFEEISDKKRSTLLSEEHECILSDIYMSI